MPRKVCQYFLNQAPLTLGVSIMCKVLLFERSRLFLNRRKSPLFFLRFFDLFPKNYKLKKQLFFVVRVLLYFSTRNGKSYIHCRNKREKRETALKFASEVYGELAAL